VDGATNDPTGPSSSANGEVALDIEVIQDIVPDALLVVYFAPNTDAGFENSIIAAYTDTTSCEGNTLSAISISWGEAELFTSASHRTAMDNAIGAATALGIVVTVATGDNGADDNVGDNGLHADFPATSPSSLACGGTSITVSGSQITNEVVWNDEDGSTGGGVSEFFAKPTYQSGVTVPLSPSGFVGRGIPDVSGVADPETGYIIKVNGNTIVEGGTSAVAPMWAALVARMSQNLGKLFGPNPTSALPNRITFQCL